VLRALSTPKCTAAMFLMALLAILTFPTKTWAQEPIAKIGDTPYESLKDAFYHNVPVTLLPIQKRGIRTGYPVYIGNICAMN